MATNPTDISTLLRQKQLMEQMQGITGQGTQADIVSPAGLRQFDDTGGGSETTSTGVPPLQSRRGGPSISSILLGGATGGQQNQTTGAQAQSRDATLAKSGIPGLSQIAQAKQNIQQGIQNKLAGLMSGPSGPKPGDVYQQPSNPPTLRQATPWNQPTPGPGQMITLDANGQPTLAPRPAAATGVPPTVGPQTMPQTTPAAPMAPAPQPQSGLTPQQIMQMNAIRQQQGAYNPTNLA